MIKDHLGLKNLRYVAKRTLKRPIFKKIQEIEDELEQKTLFEYSIKSVFDLRLADLADEIKEVEKRGAEVFHLSSKIRLLKSRLHSLHIGFDKRDFKKVRKLFNEIKIEIDKI